MFGIGLGEIILILFVLFIISPRDIPKIMGKIGQFLAGVDKLRHEVADIEREVREVSLDVKNQDRTVRPAGNKKTDTRRVRPQRRKTPSRKAHSPE